MEALIGIASPIQEAMSTKPVARSTSPRALRSRVTECEHDVRPQPARKQPPRAKNPQLSPKTHRPNVTRFIRLCRGAATGSLAATALRTARASGSRSMSRNPATKVPQSDSPTVERPDEALVRLVAGDHRFGQRHRERGEEPAAAPDNISTLPSTSSRTVRRHARPRPLLKTTPRCNHPRVFAPRHVPAVPASRSRASSLGASRGASRSACPSG